MNLLNLAKNTTWYRQGGAAVPFFLGRCAVAGTLNFYKDYGLSYGDWVLFYKDYHCTWFFNRKSTDKTYKYFWRNHIKDINYLKRLHSGWLKKYKKFLQLSYVLLKEDLSKLNHKGLIKKHEYFSKINYDSWIPALMIDSFDPVGNKLIMEEIRNHYQGKNPFNSNEIEKLLTPEKSTFLSQQLLETLKIGKSIIKNKRLTGNLLKLNTKNLDKFPEIRNKLRKISEKYFWIKNDYAHTYYLSYNYFFKELKTILKKPEKINEEIKKIEIEKKNKKKEKEAIISKYKIPKTLASHFHFFSFLTEWREERKKFSQLSNSVYTKFLSELSRRNKINISYLKYLSPWEYKSAFKENKNNLEKELMKRKNYFLVYGNVDGKKIYTSTDVNETKQIRKLIDNSFLKHEDEIIGVTASLGYAKGYAKIINDTRDFHKINKGDILIAPMTRPEYVPVMKIAAAIVTDEGGITSHAAIVSRELKKPCIIGTQTATSVLKDNMLVEVDAKNGVVKILKK